MCSWAAAAPIVFASDRVCRGTDLMSIFHVNVPTPWLGIGDSRSTWRST